MTPRRSSRLESEACKKKDELIMSSTTTKQNKKRPHFDRDEHFAFTSVNIENPPLYNKDLRPMSGGNFQAWFASLVLPVAHSYAVEGFELYKRTHSKDPEFKIEKVLYDYRLRIGHLQSSINHSCGHICFTAKPTNSHCIDTSAKHFFVELLRDPITNVWGIIRCYTFEPSDDPGFKHHRIICPDGKKIHPGPTENEFGDPKSYEYRPLVCR